MPRPPRIQFNDAHYHIYNRGNRRERIFKDDADYAAFEAFLLEAMNRSGVLLLDWSQLPNHFHLHVTTPDGNLAEFMQRLLTRYSKYFNARHRLVGHLFQSRYNAKLVDQEAHFKEIIRYVELNPYRVKGTPLAPFGEWRWSSLHYLLQPETTWPEGCRTAFRRVLGAFHEDGTRAREALKRFLWDGLHKDGWDAFYKPKNGRFIGDDSFVERMKAQQKEPVRHTRRRLEGRMNLDGLLSAFERVSGFPRQRLTSADRGHAISRWRHAIVSMARHHYRIPVVQLAKALARRESAISMMATRSEQKSDQWREFRQLLEALANP